MRVRPGACRAYHSLATRKNVGLPEFSAFSRSLAARLAAEESSSFRASNHLVRASARPILGYGPRLSVFIFAVDAVFPVPQFAARRGDGEVKTIAIIEFAELVGRFGVLDLLDRE